MHLIGDAPLPGLRDWQRYRREEHQIGQRGRCYDDGPGERSDACRYDPPGKYWCWGLRSNGGYYRKMSSGKGFEKVQLQILGLVLSPYQGNHEYSHHRYHDDHAHEELH